MAGAGTVVALVFVGTVALAAATTVPFVGLLATLLLVGLIVRGVRLPWGEAEEAAAIFWLALFAWFPFAALGIAPYLSGALPLLAIAFVGAALALWVHNASRGAPGPIIALGALLLVPVFFRSVLTVPAVAPVPSVAGAGPFVALVALASYAVPWLLAGASLVLAACLLTGRGLWAYGGALVGVGTPLLGVALFGVGPTGGFVVLLAPVIAVGAGATALALAAWGPVWHPLDLRDAYRRRLERAGGPTAAAGTGRAVPAGSGGRGAGDGNRSQYPPITRSTIAVLAPRSVDLPGLIAPLRAPPPSTRWNAGGSWEYDPSPRDLTSFDPAPGGPLAPVLAAQLTFLPTWRNRSVSLFGPAPLFPGAYEVLGTSLPPVEVRGSYFPMRSTAGVLILLDPREPAEAAAEYRVWIWQYLTFLAEFANAAGDRRPRIPIAVVALPGGDRSANVRAAFGGPIPELLLTAEDRFDPSLVRYYALDAAGRLAPSGHASQSSEPLGLVALLRWMIRAAPAGEGIRRATAN